MSKDRYKSPHPLPTPYERELLVILIEECAEVQQRATKALRFGLAEREPDVLANNSGRLLGYETGHLLLTIDRAVAAGIIPLEAIAEGKMEKEAQLAKYMQTDPPSCPVCGLDFVELSGSSRGCPVHGIRAAVNP